MRDGPTRTWLLSAISSTPKNKYQLAKEVDVEWKTAATTLKWGCRAGRLEERILLETSKRYYAITKSRMRIMSLLSHGEINNKEDDGNIIKNY